MIEGKKPVRMWYFVVLAKLAKLVKLLKFGKVLLVFGSMLLSVVIYSFALGPLFAVAFVLMLFIHEMGHIIALRVRGYETPGPVFIPMIGAVIAAPKFHDGDDEAFVGYGGPFLGGIAALVVFALWVVTGRKSEILLLTAYIATFLNLFNLLPVRPLDGGRVMQVAGPWAQWIGGGVLLVVSAIMREPCMLYIWIIVLGDFKISRISRLVTSVMCWSAMAALMTAGFGEQVWPVNVVDCVISGIFIWKYWAEWRKKTEEIYVEHVPLPKMIRVRYITAYFALGALLLITMNAQKDFLPKRATRHYMPKTQVK